MQKRRARVAADSPSVHRGGHCRRETLSDVTPCARSVLSGFFSLSSGAAGVRARNHATRPPPALLGGLVRLTRPSPLHGTRECLERDRAQPSNELSAARMGPLSRSPRRGQCSTCILHSAPVCARRGDRLHWGRSRTRRCTPRHREPVGGSGWTWTGCGRPVADTSQRRDVGFWRLDAHWRPVLMTAGSGTHQ